MKLPSLPAGSVKAGISAVMKWAITGGLLLWAITATVQWYVARHDAQEAAVQTYNMSRVAAFRDSGAELDKKVAAFNDAAAEGRSLTEPRQAVRNALADHSAKTFAMKDAFGDAETDRYAQSLKALQAAIENAHDASHSGPIISALSQVVVERNKLANTVTKSAMS